MATYNFTIRLTSDAEPGTGLGGEVINELAPRDHGQALVVPASHVKGVPGRLFARWPPAWDGMNGSNRGSSVVATKCGKAWKRRSG